MPGQPSFTPLSNKPLSTTSPNRQPIHRAATAFVLSRGKPLILAFTWMHGDESRDVAAKNTLGRVVDLDFTIECLLADRAFASAAGIDLMQTTAPMIAPLIRRGKKLARLLDTKVSYWTEYAMYEGTAREVRFPLAICVSYQNGKRGKNGLLVRAYTACEQDARTPKQVEQTYTRFRIVSVVSPVLWTSS